MKYKVGDRVRIKSIDWYNKNKSKRGNISFPYEAEVVFTSEMSSFCGQIVTISQKGYTQDVGFYRIREDNDVHMWTDEMIEGLVEKKKKEYPKTYEECINELDTHKVVATCAWEKEMKALQRLLVCRDAYWKIAGEEKGKDKPWEPNWWDADKHKMVIEVKENNAYKNGYLFTNRILAFPTEEMRDAFYENFKELIEQCKELL